MTYFQFAAIKNLFYHPAAFSLTVCAKLSVACYLPVRPIKPSITSICQINTQDEVHHLCHHHSCCNRCWIFYCQWYVTVEGKRLRSQLRRPWRVASTIMFQFAFALSDLTDWVDPRQRGAISNISIITKEIYTVVVFQLE